MTKRVFVIHRWNGNPDSDWYPWVKNQLEQQIMSDGSQIYQVHIPKMPDTEHPKIDAWVAKLAETVGKLEDADTFIGHSIGCQTILRFLEKASDQIKISKVIMVAPWYVLTNLEKEESEVARPWLEVPIYFENIKAKARSFICVFSGDDPYVPFEGNRKIFTDSLGTSIMLEYGKGHFTEDDDVLEIPVLLKLFEV